MSNPLACLCLASLLAATAAGDVIYLAEGKTLTGKVTEIANGVVQFRTARGDERFFAMNLVSQIAFDRPESPDDQTLVVPPPPAYEGALSTMVETATQHLQAHHPTSAAVVMYLDTVPGEPPLPEGQAEYRCYRGHGYSGSESAAVGAPWMHVESLRNNDDGMRRVQIDAGPPYAIVNRSVHLEPGIVTNLGRIVLPRVPATEAVSLSGYLRDSAGVPIEGVLVSAGARRTHTDTEGFYRLDGFGLEVVQLIARKQGFVGGGTQVSIRDTARTEIPCDLFLFRPRRLSLSYTISAEGSDSFEGPGVETGTIHRMIDSPRIPLHETIHPSRSFQRFATEGRLQLTVRDGQLTFENSNAPIFYQLAEPDVRFEDIKEVGELPIQAQRCPPLTQGAVVVARGNQPGWGRGVSAFCVKFLVEELATMTGGFGEFDEREFTPVERE